MSIVVKEVTKKYGEQLALNNVSFNIGSGEIVGFLGPNGAGKSTMMKIITGYIPSTMGEVEVCGLSSSNQSYELQKKIGYLPEHNPLYLDMYVKEYLSMVGGIYKLTNIKPRVEEMVSLTGLTREAHKKIGALSKGYRQRVGLAQAMIHNPEVLILDEPTTGLDPNQIIEVRNLISEIGKEKTIMLSTHIMQEVEAICEKVIIINKGVLVANTKASEIHLLNSGNDIIIEVEFNNDINKDELLKISGIDKVTKKENTFYRVSAQNDIRAEIFKWAVENNHIILSMNKKEQNLEGVFQQLTKG